MKDKLEAMFFPSMDDFNLLKNRIEKLENQCMSLKKAFGDMDSKLQKLKVPTDSGAN